MDIYEPAPPYWYYLHCRQANTFLHKDEQIEVEASNRMKDSGVICASCPKFDQHIHQKLNTAYSFSWLN
jgi:hypothetical protein